MHTGIYCTVVYAASSLLRMHAASQAKYGTERRTTHSGL
jgi:hypothetical protein